MHEGKDNCLKRVPASQLGYLEDIEVAQALKLQQTQNNRVILCTSMRQAGNMFSAAIRAVCEYVYMPKDCWVTHPSHAAEQLLITSCRWLKSVQALQGTDKSGQPHRILLKASTKAGQLGPECSLGIRSALIIEHQQNERKTYTLVAVKEYNCVHGCKLQSVIPGTTEELTIGGESPTSSACSNCADTHV